MKMRGALGSVSRLVPQKGTLSHQEVKTKLCGAVAGSSLASPSYSDCRAEQGSAGKRWQHLLRQATQGREPARTVEQDVFRTDSA